MDLIWMHFWYNFMVSIQWHITALEALCTILWNVCHLEPPFTCTCRWKTSKPGSKEGGVQRNNCYVVQTIILLVL